MDFISRQSVQELAGRIYCEIGDVVVAARCQRELLEFHWGQAVGEVVNSHGVRPGLARVQAGTRGVDRKPADQTAAVRSSAVERQQSRNDAELVYAQLRTVRYSDVQSGIDRVLRQTEEEMAWRRR